jgi:hypothetical protein
LRSVFLLSVVSSLAIFSSAHAQMSETLAPAGQTVVAPTAVSRQALNQEALVDRMATDFYENALRHSQALRVQKATAETYQAMGEEDRAQFREQRRVAWRMMSEGQRQSLRNTKTPRYLLLSEEQKQPFRNIALDQLTASGARAIAPSEGGI